MVCGTCKALLPQLFFKRADPAARLIHHRNLASLRASRAQGCYICTLVQSEIPFLELKDRWLSKQGSGPAFLTRCYFDSPKTVKFEAVVEEKAVEDLVCLAVNVEIFYPFDPTTSTKHPKVLRQPVLDEVYVDPSSETLPLPEKRWEQVSKWFHKCRYEHSSCRSSNKLRYPTRLLDISEPGAVRLVETATLEEHPPYATLGELCEESSTPKLTASTALQLFDGVSDEDLPPAYRDAITTAQHLEIKYMWIDALCVTQDYSFDIEMESYFLADVYAGSTLNISTTGSATPLDRLFSPQLQRKVSFTLPVGTDLSYRPSQQPPLWVEIKLVDKWEEEIERGKAGKERPLSQFDAAREKITKIPRTIHFGRYQIFWACKHLTASETSPRGPSKKSEAVLSTFSHTKTLDTKISLMLRRVSFKIERDQAFLAWQKLIEASAPLILGIETDKLSVLEGIATRFQPLIGSRYGAGHWERYFIAQLLWLKDETPQPLPARSGHRPTHSGNLVNQYAPSWSWLSCPSPYGIQFLLAHASDILTNQTYTCGQRVLEISLPPPPSTPSSQTSTPQTPFLRLETPLLEVSFARTRRPLAWRFDNLSVPTTHSVLIPFPDGKLVAGILLAPAGPRAYRRIGFVYLHASEKLYNHKPNHLNPRRIYGSHELSQELRCYESKKQRELTRDVNASKEKEQTPQKQTLFKIKIV